MKSIMNIKLLQIIGFLFSVIINQVKGDLLNGNGMSSNGYNNWIGETQSELKNVVNVVTSADGNEKFVKIQKPETMDISFGKEEGYRYNFSKNKVRHLRFYYSSTNKETEDTNLRLKYSEENLTAVSFRCGHAGFVRVNDNQMIDFYNSTVSTIDTLAPKWTQCDILLDWDAKTVSVFLDEKYKGQAEFYDSSDKLKEVNQVQLYNLKPGTTSYFKDIEVCEQECEGFNFNSILIMSSYVLVFLLLMIV